MKDTLLLLTRNEEESIFKQFKNLRIMQVMPRGQKKPSQQGWGSDVLAGISLESLKSTSRSGPTLEAQPGSQPAPQLVKLQLLLGFK